MKHLNYIVYDAQEDQYLEWRSLQECKDDIINSKLDLKKVKVFQIFEKEMTKEFMKRFMEKKVN